MSKKIALFSVLICCWLAFFSTQTVVADLEPSTPTSIAATTTSAEATPTDAETVVTDESLIPDTPKPEDIPGLVTQVLKLIKLKEWPAAVAAMIVILMGIMKLDLVGNLLGKYVPKRLLPLIPLVLGAAAGGIYGWISGGWAVAAQVIVESGVLAIVFHQITTHTVFRKKANES